MRDQIICRHSCANHKTMLDPALWRNLPGEMLQMVFARLPLHQIVSLRWLSREWCRTSKEPRFKRLCANAELPYQKRFALVDDVPSDMGNLSIRLFDCKLKSWHAFGMNLKPAFYGNTMLACDGGLVCFASKLCRGLPFLIVVLNPLTNEYRVLPALWPLSSSSLPTMVQLVMDRVTNCYKVVVVDYKQDRAQRFLGKVYDSATGEWSNTSSMSELVFGYFCSLDLSGDHYPQGPFVYDCPKGEMYCCDDWPLPPCEARALVDDHLFILKYDIRPRRCGPEAKEYLQLSRLLLSEHEWMKTETSWLHLKVHDCTPLRICDFYSPSGIFSMVLHACQDSVMVTLMNNESGADQLVRTWLYDLSTFEWQDLPLPPAIPAAKSQLPSYGEAMCELRWDAVP